MIPLKHTYIQRIVLRCVVAVLLSGCCVCAVAQTQRQIKDSRKNFIYVSADAGYQSLLNEEPTIKNKGVVGTEIGVGYRMYYYHMLFSVGVEGHYGMYRVDPIDDILSFPLVDSEGDPFTMRAAITQRRDMINVADVQIPLQVGGEWGHWYGLVGAKFGLNVWGVAKTGANVTTSASYDRFADDFENMPNHYLYEGQDVVSARQPIAFNPQVYGTLELGYRLGQVYTSTGADIPYSKYRFYVAAFAEIGFLNMHQSNALGTPIVSSENPEGGMSFAVNPVYNTTTYKEAVVKNFMAGVKLTVLFELPKPNICVICKERERRNRFR